MFEVGDTEEKVTEVEVIPICLSIKVDCWLQIELVEEYRDAPYGGVPPDHETVKDPVNDWPLSIEGFEGKIETLLIGGLTVISLVMLLTVGVPVSTMMVFPPLPASFTI